MRIATVNSLPPTHIAIGITIARPYGTVHSVINHVIIVLELELAKNRIGGVMYYNPLEFTQDSAVTEIVKLLYLLLVHLCMDVLKNS